MRSTRSPRRTVRTSDPRGAGGRLLARPMASMVVGLALIAVACSATDDSAPAVTVTAAASSHSVPTTEQSVPTTASSTTAQAPESSYTPTIEFGGCPFGELFGSSPRCGTDTVPGDPTHPEGRQVVLAVALFPPTSGRETQPYAQIARMTEADPDVIEGAVDSLKGRIRRDDWLASAVNLHRDEYGVEA